MPLNSGDIAFVQFNADGTDNFAFVALVDLAPSEVILFTDNGWFGNNSGFRANEGIITWTAPAGGITAGTVVTVTTAPATSRGSVTESSDLNFSADGDQILAYQSLSGGGVKFLAALNNEANAFQADATSSNTTALPPGLVLGENAVALSEIDNTAYTGPTSGTRATLLTALNNPANWSGSDTVNQQFIGTFSVSGTGGGTVLSVSAREADKMEGNSGTTAFTFDVTRTGNTSVSASVSYGVAGAANASDFAGGVLPSGTVAFLSGETSKLIQINVAGDTVVEADEGFTLTLSGATGATLGTATVTGTIRNDDISLTRIHAVQGNASTQLPNISNAGAHDDRSPLSGQTVTIEGVVVADYQEGGQLRGFFIQEELSDQDADASTSEGIFVFTGNNPPLNVSEGSKVRVTGLVSEFFGMTQLTATTAGSIVPSPNDGGTTANLAEVPANVITLAPIGSNIDNYYEQYEGMLVTFGNKLVVSEYFEVARFGQLVLSEGERPFQYTHVDETPTAAEYQSFLDTLAHSRIILDDDNNIQNAPLPAGEFYYPHPNGLGSGVQGVDYYRGGDSITDLTGVLHWSFAGQSGTDAWRVRPTDSNPIEFTVENARPTTAPDVGGNVKVASFNVLNYFTSIDDGSDSAGPNGNMEGRGADSADELARQTAKLVEALKAIDADVFGLVELENNGGDADGGAIAAIVNALNTALGQTRYAYVNTGDVGTDAITVGLIYDATVVSPTGAAAILDAPAYTDPNGTGLQRSRPAVAQTFTVTGANNADYGASFNVVVNHLKSKGSSGLDNAPLSNPDADQGIGAGFWNDSRTKAADYLVNTWIPGDPTGQGDADWLIIGDLNAYRGETPITTITSSGYTDLVRAFGGDDGYSYVFDGQLGYLDHALANASLRGQVTGVADWHINADEVPVFDYNNSIDDGAGESSFEAEPTGNNLYEVNAARTSDHDPVLIGLDLISPVVVNLNLGNGNDTYIGTFNHDHVNGANGNDSLRGAGGDDVLSGGNGEDLLDGGHGNDQLIGGNGNDILIGGRGNDVMQGGNGSDRFDIGHDTGIDQILDFNYHNDRIGLMGLNFGELSLVQSGGDTLVQLHASGATVLVLVGVTAGTLGAEDFLSV